MNLRTCFEMGESCGLETVGEALLNVDIHATNIFPYNEINKELNELYEEYNKHYLDKTLTKDSSIKEAYLII